MAKKKTNEEFIEEVRQVVGDEYTFLEEYKNAKTKILCKHNIETCGHEWHTTANKFLQGRRCPQCSRPNYNRDTEQFKQEAYDLVGNDYEFVEEYVDSNTKIKCKHNICGHEWDVQPRHFLNSGSRCPICSNKLKSILQIKTNEMFIKEVYNLVGNEYTFLEKYINNKTKIKCRHNTCGCEWMASPSGFTSNGTRCPKCAKKRVGEKRRKTNEEFIKEVYDLVGDEYIFVEKYVNANTKIKCKHNECGYEWYVLPNNFLRGQRCPNHRITTNEEFVIKVKELVGDEYVFLEDYTDTKTKIKCKHNIDKCGYEWKIAPNKFLQGRRCPNCNNSYGEEQISVYLKENNIKAIPEYKFDDCRNERPLPFDFYLPDYNLLIEYDGKQHFQPIEYFGGQEQFEYQQQNDNIKNQYCKENNIPLLRIPYWEFDNIEEILFKKLSKLEVKIA